MTLQLQTDHGAIGSAAISRISAGHKNRLQLETLRVGRREQVTLLRRDPAALPPPGACLATIPAGHPQGYHDCFDAFVADAYAAAVTGKAPDGLPQFADGLRAASITAAVLASARIETWVDVPDAAALTAEVTDV